MLYPKNQSLEISPELFKNPTSEYRCTPFWAWNTDMTADMLTGLSRAFPAYQDYKHNEGNSTAHIKSSMMGCEIFVFVSGAWPLLGPWQAIYFYEFDGPRERRFYVKVVEC